MGALVDTGVLLCGCLLLTLIMGQAGAATVIWLIAAVTVAGLSMNTDQRQWEIATSAAYFLVGALSTDSMTRALLVICALARLGALTTRRARMTAATACAPFVAAAASRVQDTPVLTLTLAFCALTALLALRTIQEEAARKSLHAMRDDLRGKVLTLQDADAQLLQAQDYELRAAALAGQTRVAHEIHDGAGHLLTHLLLQVKALQVVHREEPGVVAGYPAFWQMTIDNDGIVPAKGGPAAADRGGSDLGLRSVAKQVKALDGRVRIISRPWFTVFVMIPRDG